MARYYYGITSAKPLREEKSVNGHKTVKIKGVIAIIENGNDIHSHNNIKNGRKDIIANILFTFAIVALLLFAVLMLIADFAGIGTEKLSLFTSDYVASAGLLATMYSFPRVRKFIGEKVFYFGEYGNKLYIWIIVFILSAFIAIMLYILALTSKFANIISAVCVIFTLKNIQ